ncbi:DUF6338 family protein [Streptomyces botrytidirepellens]|uniref:Uncharacterized protein n=1 Tax=Streptomyces botrytidirepellens TaxID=2486417 RepID=A0A3M8VP97_9ACTN|nr:DUF6338 family protein [Streptomyces botrytidirepellens]RNG18519.1 hypothetical protein EEJ42_26150 [Streptomyces botrytidirepellens]
MPLPSTVPQLLLIVVALLPGITYQLVREHGRGPVPAETETGHRILRALTASVVLDSLYFAVLGTHLVELLRPASYPARTRDAALHALLLLFALPALGAALLSWRERRTLRGRYRPTPTAWDHVFRDRGASFVRVRLKDGTWVGGWFGSGSYATSYPQPPELYLQSTWRMAPDGSFVARVDGTSGLYVRAEDIDILELLEPPSRASPRPDGA